MSATDGLTKRVAISKANARMVAIIAMAAFVTVFCLVASKAVFSQNQYYLRVTSAKQQAYNQLQKNITAFSSLNTSYNRFNCGAINTPYCSSTNIIGGSMAGTGNNAGNNTTIILDALPDNYDFPALTASIQKILTDRGFQIASISGTDDQAGQGSSSSTSAPQPVSIPFSFGITDASYTAVNQLMTTLQESTRPIQIDSLNLSGNASSMTVSVNAHTYYQPAVTLTINKKAVK